MLLAGLCLLCALPLRATNAFLKDYSQEYKQLTIRNGLVHGGVTSMLKDRRGYIWIGTYDGLNRYNGQTFRTFKNSLDARPLRSNRVRCLQEDELGNVWVGTDEGVNIYRYNRGRFARPQMPEIVDQRHTILSILPTADRQGMLCFTEKNIVLHYDLKMKLVAYHVSPSRGDLTDVIRLSSTHFLLSSTDGLVSFDSETQTFSAALSGTIGNVVDMAVAADSTVWVVLKHGLTSLRYAKEGGAYTFIYSKQILYPDKQFRTLSFDTEGRAWLGFLNDGFCCLPYEQLKQQVLSEVILPQTRTSGIHFLDDKSVWVSTFDSGVYHFFKRNDVFKSLLDVKTDKRFLKMVHMSIFDDERILLKSYLKNSMLYNCKTRKVEPLPTEIAAILDNLSVRFVRDANGTLWFYQSQGEIMIVKTKEESMQKIRDNKLLALGTEVPSVMSVDMQNNLWLGFQKNLYRVSFSEDNRVEHVESIHQHALFDDRGIEKIRSIYPDSETNTVWVGTDEQGLYRIKLQGKSLLRDLQIEQYQYDKRNPHSLSSNFVSSIIRIPGKDLWLGTEQGGLCKVVEGEDGTVSFERFSKKNGLSHNVVKNLQYDRAGYLWVATNIGLNRIDVEKKKCCVYRTDDGLPFDEFWYKSVRMPDGMLSFSGLNDICTFQPDELPTQEELPNVEFTTLKLFNMTVFPGRKVNGRVLLKKQLRDGSRLSLKHDEPVFSIGIDALYAQTSDSHQIKYRLSPMSKKWVILPASEKQIAFNGLPDGDYTLQVSASDLFGNWTKPKTLHLQIEPPYWRTTSAYLFYVLCLGLLFYALLYSFMRFQRLQHRLEIEALEKENLSKINEEKQRYFSNISHELKTPLTLLLAPLDVLFSRFSLDVDAKEKLEIIRRQSKKLFELIEMAHDMQMDSKDLLRKMDSPFSFDSFVEGVIHDFRFMASYDDKQLELHRPEEPVFVCADRSMMEKVINNLLNNAFKYTRTKDSISLSYAVEGDRLRISVADTGYGIPPENIAHIFKRFYQAKQPECAHIGGTGIGLSFSQQLVELHGGTIAVESELGKGSVFTVLLPILCPATVVEQGEVLAEENHAEEAALPAFVLGGADVQELCLQDEWKDAKVFLVEDNAEMRAFVSEVLSQFFVVQSFANGKECVQELQENWPDLIVSDVMMPEMDGYELCHTVKSNMLTCHIPIVLLTACSAIDDRIKALEYGADKYIPKPFYPKHLVLCVEMLLKGRAALRKRYEVGLPQSMGGTDEHTAKENQFMEKLFKLFSENLSEEVDMDVFAAELGLSRSLFYQKVKAVTDLPPYELFRQYRLKKAAELLKAGEMNVTEVCMETGFKSRTNFSRLFKDTYGISPAKYGKT